MGLDFSHGEARWSYGTFQRFRKRLAASIGLDWGLMLHDAGDSPAGTLCGWSPHNHTDEQRREKSWEHAEKHDIYPLLNHSDCDGELDPDECRRVARGLRSIVSLWPEDDNDRLRALELASGCDAAADAGENLEFI